MFNVTNAKPGDTWTRCIKVTYGGTLPADVHLYLKNTTGALGAYLTMTMNQGTQAASTFPDCTGFTPDSGGGLVYAGPATSTVDGTYEGGLALVPLGQTAWAQGTTQVYKFAMTLDPATPEGMEGSTTGAMTVVWEARNHA
jgi:hypothetical protein